MSDRTPTPADQAVRCRIERQFDVNFLVEAGAGSGKTHSLARRMAAGISAGHYEVEHMAAVTFTRKAAAELRGRFQRALEDRLRVAGDDAERRRLEAALSGIERFFAGTIHAFCARLLRERPVEAHIAPGFVELDEVDDERLRGQAFRDFVVARRARGWRVILDLQEAGIRPADLDGAFSAMCDHEDVDFPPGETRMPELASRWAALDAFWAAIHEALPDPIGEDTTCGVQRAARDFAPRLRFSRRSRPAVLASLLQEWDGVKVVKKRWGNGSSHHNPVADAVKALVDDFQRQIVAPFLVEWRQYVYGLAVTVLDAARRAYAEERRRRNVVNYVDLLIVTATLLRECPPVLDALQQKCRWLFIDEFQDTDPVQAEIFLRLAAERGADPTADVFSLPLRPGALFVVGDPKQSIYRFRRADIDIYNRVKASIAAHGGEVLALTANWRSRPGVCALANTVFASRFPAEATAWSPRFERLDPTREDGAAEEGPCIAQLSVPADVAARDVPREEAMRIARYIREEVACGRRRFGSFLVLTRNRPRLRTYADVFDELEVPVEVSGAGRFGGSAEVAALSLLLRVLADPIDGVSLVGVLRGPLFGMSDSALYEWKLAGGRFDVTAPWPASARGPVLDAMRQMQEWYRATRSLPLGVAVERILEGTGWLALAATTPGGAKAGDLLQAIDRVRQVVELGGGISAAAEALDLEDERGAGDVEALPLEPGRRDVVRLMNLHKAKGLEADVVFLADPCHAHRFDATLRIERDERGPRGYLRLLRPNQGSFGATVIGEPTGWGDHERAERPYLDAEEDRLLYVAATRARDLVVVGRWLGKGGSKAWGAFDSLVAGAPELEEGDGGAPRDATTVDLSAPARARALVDREAAHATVRESSWLVESVTRDHAAHAAPAVRIRRQIEVEPGLDASAPEDVAETTDAILGDTPGARADAGLAWGRLVHGLLEHAMRRPSATPADLARLGRWLTVETPELRPVVDEAVAVVGRVAKAPFWSEARAADETCVEVPFAICLEARPDGRELPTVLRGVIDLAYGARAGWRIVDYKTDQYAAASDLVARHGPQLEAYRAAWRAATGASAVHTGIFSVRAHEMVWTEEGS
jgi:ATP-dependent helicase/nuclease subunit A